MHIIFGGAFNGKRQYAKERLAGMDGSWHEGSLPETGEANAVIAGLEHWVKKQLDQGSTEEQIMSQVKKTVSQKKRDQIWILTDMNRGIVPADALERELRDVIGRIYQYLFAQAEHISRIWYGIPQTIKGADEDEDLYENRR